MLNPPPPAGSACRHCMRPLLATVQSGPQKRERQLSHGVRGAHVLTLERVGAEARHRERSAHAAMENNVFCGGS